VVSLFAVVVVDVVESTAAVELSTVAELSVESPGAVGSGEAQATPISTPKVKRLESFTA
jgi:hypothetical protein